MCSTAEILSRTWGDLGEGVHVCSIHRGDSERFVPILPFFRGGYDKQEKCLYIYNEHAPMEIYSEFDHKQTYPDDLRNVRQMEILPYSEAYTLKDGAFDTDLVIERFQHALDDALAQGYAGLRVAGEMDWVLTSGTPMDKYLEYEMKINTFFPGKRLIGVCQFDADKFSKQFLLDMVVTHPYIILEGRLYQNKYFYTSPVHTTHSTASIPVEDYQIVISTILEDEPLIA